jgi:hypothetical protein
VTAGFTDKKEAHDFLDEPRNAPSEAMVDFMLKCLLETLREPLQDFLLNRAESHMVHQPVLMLGDDKDLILPTNTNGNTARKKRPNKG